MTALMMDKFLNAWCFALLATCGKIFLKNWLEIIWAVCDFHHFKHAFILPTSSRCNCHHFWIFVILCSHNFVYVILLYKISFCTRFHFAHVFSLYMSSLHVCSLCIYSHFVHIIILHVAFQKPYKTSSGALSPEAMTKKITVITHMQISKS